MAMCGLLNLAVADCSSPLPFFPFPFPFPFPPCSALRSWREFPHPDEEDIEGAEGRDHRRWIERNNSKLREKVGEGRDEWEGRQCEKRLL